MWCYSRKIGSHITMLCCLLGALFTPARAQPAPLFTHTFYPLPNSTSTVVYDMCLDNSGRMWLATDAGLLHFNGRTFGAPENNFDGAVKAVANTHSGIMAVDEKGRVRTLRGDSLWRHKSDEQEVLPLSMSGGWVPMISTAGAGVQLCFPHGKVSLSESKNGLPDDYVYRIWPVTSSQYYLATDKGVAKTTVHKSGLTSQLYTTAQGLTDNICISLWRTQNLLFIGTYDKGINVLHETTQRIHFIAGTETYGSINDLVVIAGTLWAATEKGWLLQIEVATQTLEAAHPLQAGAIKKLLPDDQGQLWCGTTTGLVKTGGQLLNQLPEPPGFSLQKVTFFFGYTSPVSGDEVLLLALQESLYTIKPNQEKKWRLICRAPAPISALWTADDEHIWMGTVNRGLWLWESATKQLRPQYDALSNHNILYLTGTKKELWVSNMEGVHQFVIHPNHTLQLRSKEGRKTGLGNDYVYEIMLHGEDVYFATDGHGIIKRNKNHHFSRSGLQGKAVYALAQKNENLWAITNDGLYVNSTPQWSKVNMLPDEKNEEYNELIATSTGIALSKANAVLHYNTLTHRLYWLNRESFAGLDSFSTALHALVGTSQGRIYVPFSRGVLQFAPPRHSTGALLQLRSVQLFFKENVGTHSVLAAHQNHLTFHFDYCDYTQTRKPFYRYQLKGQSNDWITTTDQSVTFPRLPHGRYEFVVQADKTPQFLQPVQVAYPFVIQKPLYKNYLFLASIAALMAGALGYYMRARERRLQQLNALQQERLHFEYEHLRSQIQPHFLFNSLNTLTALIEENPTQAARYTTQLSDLYRSLVSYIDEDAISLQEEWTLVQHYLYIQQTRFGSGLVVNNQVHETDRKRFKIPPLSLQLLMENALKHNVVSEAQPLCITLKITDHMLEVSNNLQPKLSQEKSTGLGLRNILHRYQVLTEEKVQYGVVENRFLVKLPLL